MNKRVALLVALGVCAAAVGCRKSKEPAGGPTPPPRDTPGGLPAKKEGGAPSKKDLLVGTWEFVKQKGDTVEFTRDGTYRANLKRAVPGEPTGGRYELEGDTLKLTKRDARTGKEETRAATIRTLTDKELVIEMGPGEVDSFQRKSGDMTPPPAGKDGAGAVRTDPAEDRAAQAVQKLRGRVTRDEGAPGKPVISVSLNFTEVTDAGLKELAGLKRLQRLELVQAHITDAGLKELAGLGQLRELYLTSATKVTDAGLKELAGLKQLRTLRLDRTQVTDVGLKELAGLTQLRELSLKETKVTDAGLKELAGLRQLETLNLNNTGVTDAGLKQLADLKHLRSLDLFGTKVTDAGLKQLAGLTQLRRLNVSYTKVTDAGAKELHKALPGCRILPYVS